MEISKTEWKLVIKLDITATNIRFKRIKDNLKDTDDICNTIFNKTTSQPCQNMRLMINETSNQITYMLN